MKYIRIYKGNQDNLVGSNTILADSREALILGLKLNISKAAFNEFLKYFVKKEFYSNAYNEKKYLTLS